MGMLVDGIWVDRWYDTKDRAENSCARTPVARLGHRRRQAGGRPQARLQGRARPLSSLCLARLPWAHRTLIFRKLKKLEDCHLGLDRPPFHGQGRLDVSRRGRRAPATRSTASISCTRSTPRPIPPIRAASPCRCCGTSRNETIVSNESAEIIRMLNSAFDEWGDASLDFYPEPLRGEIDRVNALRLPDHQQRRLPGRLRDDAGGL